MRQGGEPQGVQVVRQGEPTPYHCNFNRLYYGKPTRTVQTKLNPPRHPYLNLQQGNVESYCAIVPKKQLPQWHAQGWLPHYAVGLSRRAANCAYMVYGFMRFWRRDVLVFGRPVLLAEKSVVGCRIDGFCTHLGTYGMGGPGFFGLLLDSGEYLVYTAWHAASATLLDGRPIEVPPHQEDAPRGWVCEFGQGWDELSPMLAGCEIAECVLEEHRCTLCLQKGGATHLLEFLREDGRLAPNFNGGARVAYETGKMADYLVFQHKDAWLVV